MNVVIYQVEEEGLIKSFYAKKIQETCGRHSAHQDLRRSEKVQVRMCILTHELQGWCVRVGFTTRRRRTCINVFGKVCCTVPESRMLQIVHSASLYCSVQLLWVYTVQLTRFSVVFSFPEY